MADAYRLAHYDDTLCQTAQTVEQGVVERIRQRAARPAENGTRPGGAAVTGADVASMTRAQREALERRALHGVKSSRSERSSSGRGARIEEVRMLHRKKERKTV